MAPATDVFEDGEGTTIQVELPGVRPADLVVSLEGDVLVVEAERAPSRPHAGGVVRLEGRYGRMRREFPLHGRAHLDRILAELRHGVLRIFVPRMGSTSTVNRRLEIDGEDAGDPVEIV